MQSINYDNIPAELRSLKSWVLWKYLVRHGSKTKVLYQANGAEAKTNDPSTWSDFTTIRRRFAAGNWEGIGFVFSPDDQFCGIDLDGCRNPETGITETWAKELVNSLSGYAELSPSLSGIKVWVRAKWPDGVKHKVQVPEMAKVCAKEPGIEVYDWGRFFTVTGRMLERQREIKDSQIALDAMRERYFPPVSRKVEPHNFRSEASIIDRARKYIAKLDPAVSGSDGHGKTFHAACVLVKGFGLSEDDALSLLAEWNTTHCQPPWSDRELSHKIDSASRAPGEVGYLRNVSPENYQRVPVPTHREPGDESPLDEPPESDPVDCEPDELENIRVTTLEDATRKIHREYIDGKAKLIPLGLPELDDAIGGGVEPGEMIIFAGRPNHGKSMAAQQVTYRFTGAGIPVLFVSEEMPARLIGKRAIHYVSPVPSESWGSRAAAVSQQLDAHFSKHAPCYIAEGCGSAERVAVAIRRYVKDHGVGLVVVDYAQKLTASGGRGRYEEITKVSIALKNVLVECQIPGIILCQMSRAIESRSEFVPVMSDLKESGQFEQDADVIIFLVWPHKIDSEKPPNEYLVFIGKTRNRETNKPVVKCKFEPGRQRLVHANAVADTKPSLQDYPSDFGTPDRAEVDLDIFGP